MFRLLTSLALTLVLTGLHAAAPVPVPPPADNGPSDQALRQAVRVVDGIETNRNTRELSRLWCEIADLRRKLGDRNGARDALELARRVAEKSEQPPIEEWRQIGQAYGRLGDAKAVSDLAAAIPVQLENRLDNPRETVIQESALEAARAGHTQEAEKIADALTDDKTKEWVMATIRQRAIVHRAKTGDVAGALRAVEGLPSTQAKIAALVGCGWDVLSLGFDDLNAFPDEESIASVQLAAGDKKGAKETALKALALLPSARASAWDVVRVVRFLARIDDLPSARQALAQFPAADPKEQNPQQLRRRVVMELKAKGYLAAAEVRAGRDEVALAMAGDFPEPDDQAYILHFAALAQARAGRKEAAKVNFAKAIELVAKGTGQSTTLHNIASAQALAGDFVGAAKTTEKQGQGSVTWGNIVYAHLEAGDFATAKKTAVDHIANQSSWLYPTECKFIAKHQAQAGQVAAVKEWAENKEDQLLKAHILVGLAEGLYREGGKISPPQP
jgi:tetratricopeptide (TPR) repeat protein